MTELVFLLLQGLDGSRKSLDPHFVGPLCLVIFLLSLVHQIQGLSHEKQWTYILAPGCLLLPSSCIPGSWVPAGALLLHPWCLSSSPT